MRRFRLVLSLAVLLAPLRDPLGATDFVVTRYDDPPPNGCLPADCSLREAVLEANEDEAADRILLSAGTYALTRVGEDLTAQLGDLDVLEDLEIVGPGATMTVIEGSALGSSVFESMIHAVGGLLTLRDLTLAGHQRGGVRPQGGDLRMERCVIRNVGGAGGDGALTTTGGEVTLIDTSIYASGSGVTTIGPSTSAEPLNASNASSILCSHCTIVGSLGGNAEVVVAEGFVDLVGSIVVGECADLGVGTIESLGGNLESPGETCGFFAGTDADDVDDAGLSALGDHGGPTPTFDLDADSPAVGHGPFATCTEFDQRGVDRLGTGNDDCDAGAVEHDETPPTPIFHDGFEQGQHAAWDAAVPP
jgi:hypothetical protein